MPDAEPAASPGAPASAEGTPPPPSETSSSATSATSPPQSTQSKSLGDLRAVRREALRNQAKPSSAATSPATAPGADVSGAGASERPSTSSETQKDESSAAAEADQLAALIAEDRRIRAEAKRVREREAELKQLEPSANAIKAANDLLAKGDRVGAIRAVFPQLDLVKDLFPDIANLIDDTPAETPPVDVEKLVATRVAAELEEARKREAEEREQQKAQAAEALQQSRAAYLESCNKVFSAKAADYPGLTGLAKMIGEKAAGRVIAEKIIEKIDAHYNAKGEVLSEAQALALVNSEVLPEKASAPPPETVTSAWRADPGRPAVAEGPPKTLDEARERRRAVLRQQAKR